MDLYDINKYTDEELYTLLDLTNPSDRVLEAKIIQMINKYSLIANESGRQLTKLFQNVYNRFFSNDDSDIENDSEEHDDDDDDNRKEGYVNYDYQEEIVPTPTPTSNPIPTPNPISENILTSGGTTIPETKTVDYIKGITNPLQKQTTKRIISIDSQYRVNRNGLSTQFTFNLSEPLKDVLALRLYSIQIPYTWYTISNNYGSNFFYLKGTKPGIDIGNFDYKIEINSGNYTPNELTVAINNSISKLKNTHTDVSFGSFGINYNSSTCLSTMTIDFTNIFNETNYQMEFENWSAPQETNDETGVQLRYSGNTTLAAYLGFNSQTYRPNTIYGIRNLPIFANDITYISSSVYYLDGSNNYFDIIQYKGPDEYISDNSLNTIRLYIDLPINRGYSRKSLFDSLSASLPTNTFLTNESNIQRFDISFNSDIENAGHSYYQMQLFLNKYNTLSLPNIKTVVIFPDETDKQYPIWLDNVNNQAAFSFKSRINELNNILAESDSKQTNYIINSSPYFILKCIEPGYENPNLETQDEFTFYKNMSLINYNDYKIIVPNSTNVGGYSLFEYLDAINAGIQTTNLADDNVLTNVNINEDLIQNKAYFHFDINKEFNQSEFILDLSGSDLNTIYKIGGDTTLFDLSNSAVIQGTPIPILSSYGITRNNPIIAKVLSKPNTTHASADNWNVPAKSELTDRGTNLTKFINLINSSFQSFSDSDNSKPLLGVTLSYVIDFVSSTIQFKLEFYIKKKLTENNYELKLYDLSADPSTGWDSDPFNPNNSWNYNLKMANQVYNLQDVTNSYTDIYGNNTISGYTMTVNEDTYINFKAMTNGITTTTMVTNNDLSSNPINVFPYNDIQIKLPARSTQYTRQEIYNIINEQFDANPITSGSRISTYTVNENGILTDYVKIRPNINKIYTPSDYQLVFYDPFSFVNCFFGAQGVQNTTWDSTLGWILGFRLQTNYNLSTYINPTTQISTVVGDTATTTNIYNYFLIILDDYTQSHLNDGLITLTNQENNIPLPSYASRSTIQCLPNQTNKSNSNNQLTNNQIYAANQILQSRQNIPKNYSMGPFIQDIFGLIPMKVTGLQTSGTYIEFGGTLQNQERTYFGPVNIHRMTIQLITDRGDLVDLNGSNWSFSLICEQLYSDQNIK
jgi:hypothetical protein